MDVFSVLLKDTDIHPTRKDFQTIACIIRRILDIPELTPGLLTLPLLNETLNEYREVVVHGQKRDEQRKEIEAGFTKEILSINAKQTVAEWNGYPINGSFPDISVSEKSKRLSTSML